MNTYSNEGHAASHTLETQGYIVHTSRVGQRAVDRDIERLNAAYPIGTKVVYWRGALGVGARQGTIRAPFDERSGTVMGWISGCAGGVAISHISPGEIEGFDVDYGHESKSEPQFGQWISVDERMPAPGKLVLFTTGYETVIGLHYPKHYEEGPGDWFEGDLDWTEDGEQGYFPEGWYEWHHWDDTGAWGMNPATHWMPLPENPMDGKE